MGAIYIKLNAEGRGRTGTVITDRRILSPVRLPIPPPRHKVKSGRRDSNPRPPPWQGDVLPLNYFRMKHGAIKLLVPCRLKDSNLRPPVYKTDALPTELSRQKYRLEPPIKTNNSLSRDRLELSTH